MSGGSQRVQADGGDKAAAQALFDEGRQLLSQGRFDEACEKFEASQRIDAGLGTQLNLADCYERSGRTASAWAEFREASAVAHKSGSKRREAVARQRAAALESQLSYLTLEVADPQHVTVTRNDTPVDPALFGNPVPVDPGEQVVSASAPGKQTWTSRVRVATGGERASLRVPKLKDEAATATDTSTLQAGANASADGGSMGKADGTTAAPGDRDGYTAAIGGGVGSEALRASVDAAAATDRGATQRTWAWISAGAAVVGLGVGGAFGLHAASRWSIAKDHCTPVSSGPLGCDETGYDAGRSASTSATLSSVGFIIGAAGAAAAVVLWVSAPSAERAPQTAWLLQPNGLALRSSF